MADQQERRNPSGGPEPLNLLPAHDDAGGAEKIGVRDEHVVFARELEDDVEVGNGDGQRKQD